MEQRLQPDEIKHAAAELLTLSHRMLASAQSEQWHEVFALEAQRRHNLQQLFAVEIPPSLLQTIRDEIEEIIRTDEMLVSLSTQLRDTLTRDMRTIIKGRTAVHAYHQHSR